MDDESQRLGLLTPPIRKTQLTYDQIPPFGRIGDFQSLCIVMGGLEHERIVLKKRMRWSQYVTYG